MSQIIWRNKSALLVEPAVAMRSHRTTPGTRDDKSGLIYRCSILCMAATYITHDLSLMFDYTMQLVLVQSMPILSKQ